MKLDFITLYIIILFNSVGFALVWLIIAALYQSLHHAAQYWCAALIMTCIGGPLLILGEDSQWWIYAGNLLIIGSSGFLWQGARVFYNQQPLWIVYGVLITISALAMIILGSSRAANNLIIAMGQLCAIGLAIWTLLATNQRYAGTWVAAGALLVLVSGQGAEAIANALRLMNMLSTDSYYQYAAWFLVAAIIGGSIANLGFLLMAIDQLKSELQDLALHDELTGLPNRRALNERLLLIEKRAKRLQRPVTVLMMDLDKFKMINDSFGHFAGDSALKHLAKILQQHIEDNGEDNGFLARIGGDEFCILIPDMDREDAKLVVQKLTNIIADTPFYWKNNHVKLATSIGFTCWSPMQGVSLSDSLAEADHYLIRTKRNNQIRYEPNALKISTEHLDVHLHSSISVVDDNAHANLISGKATKIG